MLRALSACAAVAALSACAGALDERISGGSFYPAYTPSGFSAFAAAGPIVEIHGARPGGADDAAIAEALRLPGWFPQTPFSAAEPGAPPEGRQRIVLNFGAASEMSTVAACEGRISPGAIADRLTVAAAFCVGRRPATGAHLSHERPLAPPDPEFSRTMTRLFSVMLPASDPRQRDDRRGPRIIPPRP